MFDYVDRRDFLQFSSLEDFTRWIFFFIISTRWISSFMLNPSRIFQLLRPIHSNEIYGVDYNHRSLLKKLLGIILDLRMPSSFSNYWINSISHWILPSSIFSEVVNILISRFKDRTMFLFLTLNSWRWSEFWGFEKWWIETKLYSKSEFKNISKKTFGYTTKNQGKKVKWKENNTRYLYRSDLQK